jgi:hypothetical protein
MEKIRTTRVSHSAMSSISLNHHPNKPNRTNPAFPKPPRGPRRRIVGSRMIAPGRTLPDIGE